MSIFKLTVIENEKSSTIEADSAQTLLEALRRSDVEVHAPCGGNGTCKRCLVTVSGACRDLDGVIHYYDRDEVLSCRCYPAGDLVVRVSTGTGAKVLSDAQDIHPCGEGYGLAIDIGTTTVAAYLYDLATGKCLKKSGAMNAQRPYGGDVISRIQYASQSDGLARLRDVIRKQLTAIAAQLCEDLTKIRYISIAANTVMEHLFAGLSPESIGVAPFTPLSLFGAEEPASKYLSGFADDCKLYLCPAVAGYVGGDITAGLMSSGAYLCEETVLFIDIGTNGEMGLGNKDGFLCCATAAGPAFEGSEIECGSAALDGAINTVASDLSFTTIGGTEPKSICGSGLIDAVAALLKNEILDETGRMDEERYDFSDTVYLSGKDVRQVQLAKAAIRAGIETLLERSGKTHADIDKVFIAGGFGAFMNVKSACAIGLLPPDLQEKTHHVGNSAGKGASMALSAEGRALLAEITEKCRYEELSSSPLFNDKYIEAMMFDEWEDVL